jgi:hypothetical protein
LFEKLITTSLSVPKLSPSLVVWSAACCVYVHSNSAVTDTSAAAYEEILAAATRAEEFNSYLRIT